MASTSNLSSLSFDQHVSTLTEIAKVINVLQKRPDDFADVRGQTLLHLHQSCLLISKKLEIWIGSTGTRAS